MATNYARGHKIRFFMPGVFFTWFNMWIGLQVKVLTSFGLALPVAITDSIITYVLLALICLLVHNNMRYYLPRREKYLYVIIISAALSLFWLLLVRVSLWALYKNNPGYMELLSKTATIRYAIAFLMIAALTMFSLLWYTQKEQQYDNLRMMDTQKLAREAELNKLRQQLQPHFLFNSLNSISALTGIQPEKARHMIQQLADFLRGTLKKEEEQNTSFKEDLKYLQLYLDIEKVRFGYRLKTEIICSKEVLHLNLPAMLLQPLVENAIKFGLYDTIDEVVILIEAVNNNGMLQVTIKNPFDEQTSAQIKGTGFGLSSVKRRLFLLFGRHDLLQVSQQTGMFTTQISIPQTV